MFRDYIGDYVYIVLCGFRIPDGYAVSALRWEILESL